jgi:hypothetical protein
MMHVSVLYAHLVGVVVGLKSTPTPLVELAVVAPVLGIRYSSSVVWKIQSAQCFCCRTVWICTAQHHSRRE